jgi:hypothetical protein
MFCRPCVVPLSPVEVPADRDGARVNHTPWMHRIPGLDALEQVQPDTALQIGTRGSAAREEHGDPYDHT